MTAKKEKEPKKTFVDEVAEVLKKIPVSRKEKGTLVGKIEKLADKHYK